MKINDKVRESLKKINLSSEPLFDEPLSAHTTFRCGGPADLFIAPESPAETKKILQWASAEKIPVFILGGGANLLVSDRGIRGLTLSTHNLNYFEELHRNDDDKRLLRVGAGLGVSEISARAADLGLAGFDFIYSMPGSLGGAVFMNARCYGSEISDILVSVRYLDENLEIRSLDPKEWTFSYKDTPFMTRPWLILEATFNLSLGNPENLWKRMRELEADRRAKGHFSHPCAGSIFKNNHDFGSPSGKIIDSLGLRGLKKGEAQVSELHANIIVNLGQASATDIRLLIEELGSRVKVAYGYDLEPEVIFAGDWDDWKN